MSINIIIALVLIFVGHKSRNIEMANDHLKHKILETKQEININQIELALHNDNNYLKKLYSIYENKLEEKENLNIVRLSEFSNSDNKEIFKVGFK